jgi:ribosomal protein S18 acetylase RimI-like enzyme
VGRAEFGALPADFELEGPAFELVYLSTAAPLERRDRCLVAIGELVTFGCNPTRVTPPSGVADVALAELRDPHQDTAKAVQDLRFGGRYSRDPRLGHDAEAAVYGRWVHEAVGDEARTVVAETRGQGVLVLGWGDRPRIELIGVGPDHRGKGVGRRLGWEALERCAAAGAASLEVGTYADNLPAVGLYRSLGFTERARTWRYHWWPRPAR